MVLIVVNDAENNIKFIHISSIEEARASKAEIEALGTDKVRIFNVVEEII